MAIELTVDPATLRIDLTGFDALFAIKRRLDIPTGLITAAAAMKRTQVPYRKGTWLRAPGTYVPGFVRHGSYGRSPTREFWAVYRQTSVLVVDVRDWEYVRLVLGIADPDLQARLIGTAIR